MKKLILLTALMLLAAVLSAQTHALWTGSADTNWHNSANWIGNVVPTNTSMVKIQANLPNYPVISQGSAQCRNLNVEDGGQLSLDGANLFVLNTMTVKGNITIMSANEIDVRGALTWDNGATVTISHSGAVISARQDVTFLPGSNVKFGNGTLRMYTSTGGDKFLTNQSANTEFYDLVMNVSPSARVIFAYESTHDYVVNHNFYNGTPENTTAECIFWYTGNLIVKNDFISYNPERGVDWYYGTLVMEGEGDQFIHPTGWTRVNNLCIRSGGTVEVTDDLECYGNLSIESGVLSLGSTTLTMRGDWTNYAGFDHFEAGSSRVRFVKHDDSQCHYGNTHFNVLEIDKELGAFLIYNGGEVICDEYSVVRGAVAAMDGTFTALSLANNGLAGGWYCYENGTINAYNTRPGAWIDLLGYIYMTGGTMNVYGGSTPSYWPYAEGTSVQIHGGVLDFKTQGIYLYSGFDDNAFSADITGGTIRMAGNFTGYHPYFSATGGTIELYGTEDAYINIQQPMMLPTLKINKTSLGGRVDLLSDLDCENLIVEAGTLGITEQYLTVYNDLTCYGDINLGNAGSNGIFLVEGNMNFLSGSGAQFTSGSVIGRGDFLVENGAIIVFHEGMILHLQGQGTHYITVQEDFFGFRNLHLGGPNRNAHYLISNESTHDVFVWGDLNFFGTSSLGFEENATQPVKARGIMRLGEGTLNVGPSKVILEGRPQFYTTSNINIAHNGELIINHAEVPRDTDFRGNVTIDGGILRLENSVLNILEDCEFNMDSGYIYCDGVVATYEGSFQPTGGTVIMDDNAGNGNVGISVTNGNWLPNLVLDSSTGIWLLSDLEVKGNIDVNRGWIETSGLILTCGGDLDVGNGGLLKLEPGTTVDFKGRPQSKLQIHSGGRLESLGTEAERITIKNDPAWVEYNVFEGGSVAAEYTNFRHATMDGFYVHDGAIVDEEHCFHNCAFEYSQGTEGSCLLRIENDQILTVKNAVFNRWVDTNNVRKSENQGVVHFINAGGNHHGEQYENDVYDRIFWSQNSNIQLPDLLILKAEYIPQTATEGEVVQCVVTYANTGGADVIDPFYIDLYCNQQTPPAAHVSGNYFRQILAMPAYSTEQHVFYVTGSGTGTWNSYLWIDTNEYVSESNEYNNLYGPFHMNWLPISLEPVTNLRVNKTQGGIYKLEWDYEGVCTRFNIYRSVDPYFTPSAQNLLVAVNYPTTELNLNNYFHLGDRGFFIVTAERDQREPSNRQNEMGDMPERRRN